jgi:hypothetical protein
MVPDCHRHIRLAGYGLVKQFLAKKVRFEQLAPWGTETVTATGTGKSQ